jgi:hypothetical protein
VLPASSLSWSTPGRIVRPHCSPDGSSYCMIDTMGRVCGNLKRLPAGRPLRNVVLAGRGC